MMVFCGTLLVTLEGILSGAAVGQTPTVEDFPNAENFPGSKHQEVDLPKALQWNAANEAQDTMWEFKDPASWKFTKVDGERVLSQFQKSSDYQPPHRSPLHLALIKDHTFDSFEMDVWLKSTHAEYGHRDVCLFFGYTAPNKFYYVHMASEMDDRANQIFVVNQADRIKISASTTPGTKWESQWHHVRVIRDAESGQIAVYFDDMTQPVMTAVDKTIEAGQVGLGSFDDTADFQRVVIRPKGTLPTQKEGHDVDRN